MIQETPFYEGSIRIELYPDAPRSYAIKADAAINGDRIYISGRYQVVMGGLQFYHQGKPFAFGWDAVKRVTAMETEKILWQNHKEG